MADEPARGIDATAGAGTAVRIGRALASPIGVLVTIPLVVVAVGLGILLLGRDATRTSARQMAERQLYEQAIRVREDVAQTLDQADPMLARIRVLARRELPREDVLPRLADLVLARGGVSYASISFPDGMFRGAYIAHQRGRRVEMLESRTLPEKTEEERFVLDGTKLVRFEEGTSKYDPRTRPFYKLVEQTRQRAWTEPYPFARTFETGITCTEPVFGEDGRLVAVLTVDFDVAALSKLLARPTLDQARSIVYTGNGAILAFPSATKMPETARLLTHQDLQDPALDALFAQPHTGELQALQLAARDGDYLATILPIGGQRAGVFVPLDWYVGTIVPTSTLLGPTRKLERSSVIASAGALAVAVGIALVLAWNLVRMRRQVAASREQARTAEARARELGSYRLVAKLGAGGMGEVWRAEHRLLARSAAIKLIRPEALRDPAAEPEVRERFRREAQTLASMKSRNTIEIYDYGVTDAGVFYYVMELLDGVDLETLVVKYGPQPAARVIQMMVQACLSLAEAHDAGLLHRDIKPPNLFLSRAADEVDIVKLLDFGIVQAVNEDASGTAISRAVGAPTHPVAETPKLTQFGAMLGTPGFMAPEQILGMAMDGRADLYALGCVAWWLLAGREVFAREDNEAKILHKHMYDPVPSLRAVMRTWCPPELDEVMASVLAKEVVDRPADARELARRLRAIPIPPEHAWTEEHARAWWAAYQPPVPVKAVSTSAVRMIMPVRTDEQPLPVTQQDAMFQTVRASLSSMPKSDRDPDDRGPDGS